MDTRACQHEYIITTQSKSIFDVLHFQTFILFDQMQKITVPFQKKHPLKKLTNMYLTHRSAITEQMQMWTQKQIPQIQEILQSKDLLYMGTPSIGHIQITKHLNIFYKCNSKSLQQSNTVREIVTWTVCLPFFLSHLFMDSIKHGNEEFMCVLLLVTRQICCMLPPTAKTSSNQPHTFLFTSKANINSLHNINMVKKRRVEINFLIEN